MTAAGGLHLAGARLWTLGIQDASDVQYIIADSKNSRLSRLALKDLLMRSKSKSLGDVIYSSFIFMSNAELGYLNIPEDFG